MNITAFFRLPLLVLIMAYAWTSHGQSVKTLTNLWPVKSQPFYQGFDNTVEGTELDFFPFLEGDNIVLYLGENKLYGPISFTTAPVAADHSSPYASFVWSCGYARTADGEAEKSTFEIAVQGEKLLSFDTYQSDSPENWIYTSPTGIELAFVTTFVDKAHGDRFGYMILNMPTAQVTKGEPVTISMEEIRSNKRDYYMAIQNPVEENIKILAEPTILKTEAGPKQSIKIDLTHLGAPIEGKFSVDGELLLTTPIKPGNNEIYMLVDPVAAAKTVTLDIAVAGKPEISRAVDLKPVRHFEVYFLPHSHVDIGFTHRQQEVAELQWKNLDLAIDLAAKTADYPERSRYKWNAEISWVLDGYLKQASEERKQKFIAAVEAGTIGIDALYGSVLTGIQTEEEMFNNTLYASQLAKEFDFDIQSAMITDVPGYTWGIVPGLAQMGINYLSVGPNHMPQLAHGGYQVGHTLEAWGDVPFYWVSPSGKERILFWMSTHGYSWFHSWLMGNISNAGGAPVLNFLNELDDQQYPYDIVQLRYNIGNDNGPPDPDMPDFFKAWNEKYEWPKFRIATTMEMMKAFEEQYQDEIPEATGDFTPYWEDGVASSAEETAINKNSADQLVQAETLWAMTSPKEFPKPAFDEAWKNIVLFSEHTWGANVSKSDPDSEFTKSLWDVKQGFTLDAQRSAKELSTQALAPMMANEAAEVEAVEVINTLSWDRSELVRLPAKWSLPGYRVTDEDGKTQPTQLLSDGQLAFVASDVPALGAKKYYIKKGKARAEGSVTITNTSISNDRIALSIDATSGNISSLLDKQLNHQFVDVEDSTGFNTYWYSGLIKEDLSRHHSPTITIKENGPLVSSLLIESEGEGANAITQEITLVSGLNKVNLVNTVDKLKIIENENVRFSFPFAVPDGNVSVDIPWSVMNPAENQLKGANLNFFSAQRFMDVSNDQVGITLATPDAPIWEIGDMYGQQWMTDMKNRPWLKTYTPSQRLYSWVMNNAWFVNYKAHQEGEIRFRYTLQPHATYSDAQAKKLGMEQTTPLVVIPVSKSADVPESPFTLSGSADVIVSSFKPSADGKAWMIRLFNSSDNANQVQLNWGAIKPTSTVLSSPLEESGEATDASFDMVPWEILTIRAELP
ncbi:MAG: glycoside hydrolase family 38 C-terminal domain-containing protein [Cyclobacteriaceae bacterium]